MNLLFQLPPLSQNSPYPIWTGDDFQVGDERIKVLHYSSHNAGWNNKLTEYHENAAGDNHFIDQASRNYTLYQLKKNLPPLNKPNILEIGCSSGYMLQKLNQFFPHATLIGADVVYKATFRII